MQLLDEKWFVISCDSNFTITEIINTKNINICCLQANNHLTKIIFADDLPKLLDFTLNLKTYKSVFGVEINIIDNNLSPITMNLGGIDYEGNYVIVAFSNSTSLYEDLMKINTEHVNLLRDKLKKSTTVPNDYQKFTELNNEIINMQREIYKKNASVSELLKKTTDMFHIIESQKNFFKQMLNVIPDLIFYKDIQNTYLGCNKAFAEKFIGIKEEEIIGKTDADFFKDDDVAKFFRKNDQEIFEIQQITIHEELITMADNTIIEVETLKSPFYDSNGNIGGMIGIARDISLRKSFEEKLRSAKELAEAATIMKSQFLANMSHEIRTPLNGILGFLDLLDRTNLSAEQKDYIREAKTASEVLLYLISDILDFSKIESGKLAVEDAVSILVPKASEKSIEINTMITANVPESVIGDPARLRQILNILISNAVKFTQNGEINVTVDCSEAIDEKALLRFAVKDTGVGICKQSISKLFRPFTQADASTTRKFGGTGLGLAISKELVKLMHGDISVESEPGNGSIFRFTILVGIPPTTKKPHAFKQISAVNVLIVDDNANNRKIIRSYLEDIGCKVFEADSAATAITSILINTHTDNKVNIAIVDFEMPAMNGYQLATTLKTIPFANDIKLILLAYAAEKGDADTIKEHGFLGYISKPVRRDELLSCISAVLDLKVEAEIDVNTIISYTENEAKTPRPKILLVEDNKVNRKIFIAMIKHKNLICDIAVNGSEAVTAISEKDYDIVFMDCQMPVMDGYESTAKIRELETDKKHTPIIAMTANAMEGDREKCLAAGMDDYISKPINFEIVFGMIETYCN